MIQAFPARLFQQLPVVYSFHTDPVPESRPADLRTAIKEARDALAHAERLAALACGKQPKRMANIHGGLIAACEVVNTATRRWLSGSAN